MSPTEKLVADAVQAEMMRQFRDRDGYKWPSGRANWEDSVRPWLIARAALAAIPYPSEEEIAELRKDAERYRWLRDDNAYAPEEEMIQGGEELDGFIDAQIEAGYTP